jgi:hypothetical protein
MITILATVNTSASKGKAVRWLRRSSPSALFLDFPVSWEDYIRGVARGRSWREALEELTREGLVKEPEDTQELRASLPLLRELSSFGGEVYCYRDPLYHDFRREAMDELMLLTLRAKLSGIRAESWRRVIREEVELGLRVAEREAEYIAGRAAKRSTCIDASEEVELGLRKLGYGVRRVMLDEPCRPIDVLREKIKEEVLHGFKVPDELVVKLVEQHLRFTELVVERDYEEAYDIWIRSGSGI